MPEIRQENDLEKSTRTAVRVAIRRLQKELRAEMAKDFSTKPSVMTKRRRALIQGKRRSKLWLGGNQIPIEAFSLKQTKHGVKIGAMGTLEGARVFHGKSGGKFVAVSEGTQLPAWLATAGKTFTLPRSKIAWQKVAVPTPKDFVAKYKAHGNALLKKFILETI